MMPLSFLRRTSAAASEADLLFNPQLWLEADSITGLSSGETVSLWPDKSCRQTHIHQATAGARPQFIANAVNGLPVVRFTTGKDMTITSGHALGILRSTAGGTLLAVRKHASAPSTPQVLLEIETPTLGAARAVLYSSLSTANKAVAGGRRLDGNPFQSVQSTADVGGNVWGVHIGAFNFGNAILRQYLNGELQGESLAFQTSGPTMDTDSARIRVGRVDAFSLQGDLAVAMVWARTLTAEEIASVTARFVAKYAIAI